jgi:general secretion pathway protein D
MKYPLFALSAVAFAVLSGCAQIGLKSPARLEYDRTTRPNDPNQGFGDSQATKEQSLQISTLPTPATGRTTTVRTPVPGGAPLADSGVADITVSFEQLSLPQFIQAIYGQILKKNVAIDAAVNARTDLITFRTTRPQTAKQVADLTKLLLTSYGVSVQDFDGLVRIVPAASQTTLSPQIRRGRALPEVPQQLRPIFHLVELDTVRNNDVSQWLRTMFGAKIQITDDNSRNALLISGQTEDVVAALEVVQVLDRPVLRGSRARKITPVFWSAEELAKRITELLQAQGYAASTTPTTNSPVLLMPIAPINSVMVFAATDEVLQLVLQWAVELDKPSRSSSGSLLFTYAVKHADAQDLAKVLGNLMNAGTAAPSAVAAPVANRGLESNFVPSAPAPAQPSPSGGGSSGARIVVNTATNSLVIQGGKADDYRQWMSLLAELDRPTRSALVEVVVAEVRLVGTESFGIEWMLNQIRGNSGSVTGGLNLAVPNGSGFTLNFLNTAGAVKGLLNILASNSDARILSSPKIMARNGETATIQVGSEVPIITSQQSNSNTSGGVLQTVQYRSTGVILKVRPIIHSSSRLDLEVSQEVSSAAATLSGVTSSPTISTRKVDTKLTLRDGSTVLLAGLIESTANNADTGIPVIKDVPIFGNLFKSSNKTNVRTELIVLITPYVINDEYEAESITESFKNSLGDWARDSLPKAAPLLRPVKPESLAPSEKPLPVAPTVAPAPVAVTPPAPVVVTPPAPVVVSPPPPVVVTPPAPADAGVVMSRPGAGAPPASAPLPVVGKKPAPKPSAVAKPPLPAVPSPASAAPPRPATPTANTKAPAMPKDQSVTGQPVTDQDLLNELRQLVNPKK